MRGIRSMAVVWAALLVAGCGSSSTSSGTPNGGGPPVISHKAKTTLSVTGPGITLDAYSPSVSCTKNNSGTILSMVVIGLLTQQANTYVNVNADSSSLKVTINQGSTSGAGLNGTVYQTSGVDVSGGHLQADTDLAKVSGTLDGPIHLKVDAGC